MNERGSTQLETTQCKSPRQYDSDPRQKHETQAALKLIAQDLIAVIAA